MNRGRGTAGPPVVARPTGGGWSDRGGRGDGDARCRRSLDELRRSRRLLSHPGGGENDPAHGPLGRSDAVGRGPDGLPVDDRIVGRGIVDPSGHDGIGHQLLAEATGQIDGPVRHRGTGEGRHRAGGGVRGVGILGRTWCNVPVGFHLRSW